MVGAHGRVCGVVNAAAAAAWKKEALEGDNKKIPKGPLLFICFWSSIPSIQARTQNNARPRETSQTRYRHSTMATATTITAGATAAAAASLRRRSPTAAGRGGRRGLIRCATKHRAIASTNADATSQQTVVSPSPKDPSCPSDWWKDAIVYQVRERRDARVLTPPTTTTHTHRTVKRVAHF